VVESADTVELMKSAPIFLAVAGAVVFAVAFSRPAWALGPVDIEAAARVGGGSNPLKDADINVLGFGLGGRAGVSIFGIYGGVSAMYYLGGSTNEPVTVNGAPTGESVKTTASSYLYGFEGGYSLKILLLTLRPTVEVGNYTVHVSASGFGSQDMHNVYIEPGVTALLGFGLWFVGADANIFLTPGLDNSKAAFMANGQVGVKF
jgi:hypothetical protein